VEWNNSVSVWETMGEVVSASDGVPGTAQQS